MIIATAQIYKKIMEIIYHERKPNYRATINAMVPGDEVFFPWNKITEPAQIRTICSRSSGKFTVNKIENGLKVTRVE